MSARPRHTREERRASLRHTANNLRDSADEMATRFGCDDPMHPWKIIGAPFHSWVEFVDMVARPLIEAEEADDSERVQELMRLYRLTNPHYLCTCLVMAANRAGATTGDPQ